ncbi:unnamed protein product [Symbiodinium sp. CCMP2456]|nr:unnamed protein product [Symbiodinium sp. CCMP2456]
MVTWSFAAALLWLTRRALGSVELLKPGSFSALGFMHVFKSGGSTYGVALAKYARAHHMPFFTDMREGGPSEVPRYLRTLNPGARHLAVDAPPPKSNFSIFHGHLVDMGFGKLNHHHNGAFNQFFPSPTMTRAPLLAVALREPATRLMSAFLQLTAGLDHKSGASLAMDPNSLQGGVMDKGEVDLMFAEFMKQQGVAQCRIVPNQAFGPRFAAPCAAKDHLEQARLDAMSDLLRQYILPLITERLEESAALLDVFLGHPTPPSLLQFVRFGLPVRCSSYEDWRQGRRHAILEECRDTGKGSAKQVGALVTSSVRRVVRKVMGYELWLYRNATALFETHLKLHDIRASELSTSQEFACKPQTLQGCSKKEAKFISRWQTRPRPELMAEISRLKGNMGKSVTSDINALKKLTSLEKLLDAAAKPKESEEL